MKEKSRVPLRIEIKTGSVNTNISMAADSYGNCLVQNNRIHLEEEKGGKTTKNNGFSRDVAYAYVLRHLKIVANAEEAELISEYQNVDGGCHFEFRETRRSKTGSPSAFKHIYTISRSFEVKYQKKIVVVP